MLVPQWATRSISTKPELLLVPRGKGPHRDLLLEQGAGLGGAQAVGTELGAEGPQSPVDGRGAHRGEVVAVGRRQPHRAFRFQGWEQLDEEWSEPLPAQAAAGSPATRKVPMRIAEYR